MKNLRQLSLKESQELSFQILEVFASFCLEHDLRYTLCGGTLLGAVRHGGFIPWDDDIDVFMPRPDYERMLDLTVRKNPIVNGRYLFQNAENGLPKPATRLQDLQTKIFGRMVKGETYGCAGLWVDIIPLDGMPESHLKLRTLFCLRDCLDTLNRQCFAVPGKGSSTLKGMLKCLTIPIARLIGSERLIKSLNTLSYRLDYSSSKYIGAISSGLYGVGERMERMEFEKYAEKEFEGHLFPVMGCWDSYLTGIYGDYMQLPPLEKRKTHEVDAWLLDDAEFSGMTLPEQL